MRIKFRLSFVHKSAGERFLASLPDDQIHPDVMPLSTRYARDFHGAPATPKPFPVTLIAGRIDWIRGYEPTLRAAYPGAPLLLVPKACHFPWINALESMQRTLQQALEN